MSGMASSCPLHLFTATNVCHHRSHIIKFSTKSRRNLPHFTLAMAGTTVTDSSTPSQQKIIISNGHGEKLSGVVHDTGSKEVVILCHGFRSNKESSVIVGLANGLAEKEISAFRFDFSGNGESEGEFEYANYWKEVEDLRSVALYFTENGKSVDAVIGHSKGGNVVLLYASKYHDINKVVNISGRYELQNGIKERFGEDYLQKINEVGYIDVIDKNDGKYRVTKESLMDRLQTDMKSAVKSIPRNCRVLTVHGSDDEIIHVTDASEFNKSIPCHTLHIIDGADHCYTSHQHELISIVLNFIKSG